MAASQVFADGHVAEEQRECAEPENEHRRVEHAFPLLREDVTRSTTSAAGQKAIRSCRRRHKDGIKIGAASVLCRTTLGMQAAWRHCAMSIRGATGWRLVADPVASQRAASAQGFERRRRRVGPLGGLVRRPAPAFVFSAGQCGVGLHTGQPPQDAAGRINLRYRCRRWSVKRSQSPAGLRPRRPCGSRCPVR